MVLFRGVGVEVVDFHCRAPLEAMGREEPNPTHSIVFVRRGLFALGGRGQALLADPTQILFFNRAQPYCYAHPVPGGDRCTILTLETGPALAAVARWEPRDADRPETPFRRGHALSTARSARLHAELLAALRSGSTPFFIEDTLAELVDESLRAAYRNTRRVESEGAGAGSRRRRDTVEAARLILNERYESPPRLGALASRLGCSPFHLSRIFRRLTGLSPRHYVNRLRTRLAADRLARGERDLAGLALDLGFFDQSHFTNTFRREYGVPPSRVRAAAAGGA